MEIIALVPAAGSGERLGLDVPKALAPMAGQAIVSRTIAAILKVSSIHHVYVMAPAGFEDQVRDLIGSERVSVITGGATRQQSVARGLGFYRDARTGDVSDTLVVVHDAARCLVSPELVERCIKAGQEYGAVTAAVPSVDSLKRVGEDGRVIESLDRAKIVAVQTPQVFRFDLLWKAHQKGTVALPNDIATDDASLVEAIHPVTVVPGERRNFKITTHDDFTLAQFFVSEAL